jgi:hypothetical protein
VIDLWDDLDVLAGGERPSYDELTALVAGQAAMITALQAEVAELKRQLGQNSSNSSKPPSSDSPFDKPGPKSLRRRRGPKPGGSPVILVDVGAGCRSDEAVRHEPGP